MKVVSKKRVVSILLSFLVLMTTLVTPVVEGVSNDTKNVNYANGMTYVKDENVDVRGETAYVRKAGDQPKLLIDCTNCYWDDISFIYLKGVKGSKSVLSSSGYFTVTSSDTYSMSVELKNGQVIDISMKDALGFDKVLIDSDGIIINKITLGDVELSENKWVSETGDLNIYVNCDTSTLSSDVYVNDKQLHVVLQKDGYLNIHAKTDNEKEEEQEGKFVRKERYVGECSRSFYVGEEIESEDVKATFRNGTLSLEVPKKEPKKELPEKKYIEIGD